MSLENCDMSDCLSRVGRVRAVDSEEHQPAPMSLGGDQPPSRYMNDNLAKSVVINRIGGVRTRSDELCVHAILHLNFIFWPSHCGEVSLEPPVEFLLLPFQPPPADRKIDAHRIAAPARLIRVVLLEQ